MIVRIIDDEIGDMIVAQVTTGERDAAEWFKAGQKLKKSSHRTRVLCVN